ncbi:hypothetical protein [Metabacillus niabensis]|uniref:Uncharacterized protein YcfL n=1 Tax=Metabacillus niabensis TaxID=324854 RepID=A0ABT9YZJ0_9BACI|nr:hypothetical protein [Metabacillus niabensis]MDQ0225417.1 uncharacterized protein YcfL [Metabacillus niabensis]PAD70988.1 hypothetical protein CHH83_00680 [Bacillus sp. 7586-K]
MQKLFVTVLILFLLSGCGTDYHSNTITLASQNKEKVIETEAIYIGLIDSHSIEVFINKEPYALQINEAQQEIAEKLPTKKRISIKYYYDKKTTQYQLLSIQQKGD